MFFKYFFCLEAVHKTPRDNVTTDEVINDCIAKWFRNSVDRKGGRADRALKTADKPNGNSKTISEEENSVASQQNS